MDSGRLLGSWFTPMRWWLLHAAFSHLSTSYLSDKTFILSSHPHDILDIPPHLSIDCDAAYHRLKHPQTEITKVGSRSDNRSFNPSNLPPGRLYKRHHSSSGGLRRRRPVGKAQVFRHRLSSAREDQDGAFPASHCPSRASFRELRVAILLYLDTL